MERLIFTETRKELPTIINNALTVEVSNHVGCSVILPKAELDVLRQQVKDMEKELVQQEMDAILQRKEQALSHQEVEHEIMEVIDAKLGA